MASYQIYMEDPSLGASLVFINILNYSTVVAFIISHSRPVDLTPFIMVFKDPAAAFKKIYCSTFQALGLL